MHNKKSQFANLASGQIFKFCMVFSETNTLNQNALKLFVRIYENLPKILSNSCRRNKKQVDNKMGNTCLNKFITIWNPYVTARCFVSWYGVKYPTALWFCNLSKTILLLNVLDTIYTTVILVRKRKNNVHWCYTVGRVTITLN